MSIRPCLAPQFYRLSKTETVEIYTDTCGYILDVILHKTVETHEKLPRIAQ